MPKYFQHFFLVLVTFLSLSQRAHAQGFDPFIDYSEFEEETDEEADINFFRNGRFLTVGLLAGTRGYTGNYGSIYSYGGGFGLYVAFFFDLRFALQVSYTSSNHAFNYRNILTGSNQTTATSFDIKYFVNTQNVTKGLGAFNPYIIGGLSQIYRTQKVDQTEADSRDGAMGFDIGGGFEIPISRNKAYIGAEARYIYVNFTDENKTLKDENGVSTGYTLGGDIMQAMVLIGVNF